MWSSIRRLRALSACAVWLSPERRCQGWVVAGSGVVDGECILGGRKGCVGRLPQLHATRGWGTTVERRAPVPAWRSAASIGEMLRLNAPVASRSRAEKPKRSEPWHGQVHRVAGRAPGQGTRGRRDASRRRPMNTRATFEVDVCLEGLHAALEAATPFRLHTLAFDTGDVQSRGGCFSRAISRPLFGVEGPHCVGLRA